MASMMQLSYQPAFDPYHAIYRFLRLRQSLLPKGTLHRDHFRILDFYLLFPFRIDAIKLKQAHRKFRRLARYFASSKPYGELPDDRLLLGRMDPLQSAAFETMAAKQLIDPKELEVGNITATDRAIPTELSERVETDNAAQKGLIDFLDVLATEYQLLGSDGLKDRTNLLEHRYDAL